MQSEERKAKRQKQRNQMSIWSQSKINKHNQSIINHKSVIYQFNNQIQYLIQSSINSLIEFKSNYKIFLLHKHQPTTPNKAKPTSMKVTWILYRVNSRCVSELHSTVLYILYSSELCRIAHLLLESLLLLHNNMCARTYSTEMTLSMKCTIVSWLTDLATGLQHYLNSGYNVTVDSSWKNIQ